MGLSELDNGQKMIMTRLIFVVGKNYNAIEEERNCIVSVGDENSSGCGLNNEETNQYCTVVSSG